MTTRVMFISPAMSTALREARFEGGDDALDPVGLRQAEAAREAVRDLIPDVGPGAVRDVVQGIGPDPLRETRATTLYVSPSPRCRRTAEVLGLDARPLAALAPCAMGRWQGRTLDDVAAAEPESVAAWLSDPAASPHGGESLLALHTRVGHWLDNLSAEKDPVEKDPVEKDGAEKDGMDKDCAEKSTYPADPPARLIAVAEPDVIRAAAVHALGATPRSFWRFDVRPLTVTELSGRDGRWNLLGGRPLHGAAG
ncbi:histidine phosphatase family protein [Streptomyces sp. NPDC088116]|uniref:histidine phosphatase family protein n=1 Tax=Streptomyces sp. NPDC088116 TaxID=3365825 RepID=UPI0037F1E150